MTFTDIIESSFIIVGTACAAKSAYNIKRDRDLKGMFWPSWAWAFLYESWKIPYYYHFDQMISLSVDISAVLIDIAALYFVFKFYRSKSQPKEIK